MILLYICISAVLISTVFSGDPFPFCPHNLQRRDIFAYGDYCYKVHYGNYEWHEARKICLSGGGDLIQIRDAGLQNYVRQTLSHQKSESDGFWIGATDLDHEHRWEWVSGDHTMHYGNWHPGQGPSQSGFIFSDGGLEDCALMRVDDNFRWHDYICDNFLYHYSFICQHKKLPSPTFKTTAIQFVTKNYTTTKFMSRPATTTLMPQTDRATTTKSMPKFDTTTKFMPRTETTTKFMQRTETTTKFMPRTETTTKFLPRTETSTKFMPRTETTTKFMPPKSTTIYTPWTDKTTMFSRATRKTTTYAPPQTTKLSPEVNGGLVSSKQPPKQTTEQSGVVIIG